MGESPKQPFQLSFNASLKIDFQGSRVTSDGGLILVRELDERLGFGELIQQHLTDSRRGKNTQFPFADLLRQSVYSRLAGYEDLNDAERLSQDPTFRLIGSEKIWDRGAALTSRLQSFETEMLVQEENFAGLARLNRALIGKAEAVDSGYRTILDMDSTEVPVYGEQEQSAYNGYFESTCFHPLLLFNEEGDCLAAKLRPGNVHSAEGWEEMLLPEIERQQQMGKEGKSRDSRLATRHAVIVALEVDVIVDVDAGRGPLMELVALLRQRSQGRSVQLLKQAGAPARALAKRPLIKLDEQLPDGLVEFGEAEELPMPQRGHDPALDQHSTPLSTLALSRGL